MNNQSNPQQAEENIQLQPGAIDHSEELNHNRTSTATRDAQKNIAPKIHPLEAPDFSKSTKNYKKAWIAKNDFLNPSYFTMKKLIIYSAILIISLLFFIIF